MPTPALNLQQRRRVAELPQERTPTLQGNGAGSPHDLIPQRVDALQRIRGEYIEMPGLTLTIAQASRLWRLEARVCQDLLDRLVVEGFLKRHHDSYSRT
jgi:hypothetical protein